MAILASCLLVSSAGVAAQARFTGSNRQAILDCRGGTIEVVGARNDLGVRGPCRKVSVTGAGNIVVIERVLSIEVSGAMNRVTWRERMDGRSPRISRTGVGNTVARVPSR
ncbi:DUF3060 domain-containing protein [Sphingosinicella sp. LHD-64]|uniref:DUF3060 domain-containing protein n=1 Tax=Sphingosinicella sp. LHD-64 TaxID=3072139 RepID=UPI00280D8A01|nr:DUF3060 domain-containing protein [Sphingosinicella sp. LHD-64]MDQ8756208.1 DUF3060 domain-containing protein [Sphingosinicella sp. LHD-64]